MKRYATTLLVLLCMACTTGLAQAQEAVDVTVREINDIPDENIAQLKAAGTTLTVDQIGSLIFNELRGQKVRFTAVVLSNPRNSGLATPNSEGFPGRIHIFVRDTSAASQGKEGMGIQIVDGAPGTSGVVNVAVGDVVTFVGLVNPFNTTMQVAPESIELLGPYQSFGLPDDILDPIVLSTSDANVGLEDGKVQVDWDNLEDLRGQFVRFENAAVVARNTSSSRPTWYVSSDNNESVVNIYDTSLRYRNDRGSSYNRNEFNARPNNNPFVPPPPGARVNLQGFLTYTGAAASDPNSRGFIQGSLLSINPIEDSDLEITETPPQVAQPVKPALIPAPGEPVAVTTEVIADPSRSISAVTLTYYTSADATEQQVGMTLVEGDTYTAEIPAQDDGVFVVYSVTATDNTGAETTSNVQDYRVLQGGIQSISDIQEHSGATGGASPFMGQTHAMNVTATVQTPPAFSDCSNCVLGFSIQDDEALAPYSGIFVSDSEALTADLAVGDVITITNATVRENFGVTFLRDITYTKSTASRGEVLPHKVVETSVLKDAAVAEAHEGMLLRFENATVTNVNPDAPSNFGEFSVSTDATPENAVRVDDSSVEVPVPYNQNVNAWERLEFVQGVWWFAFSNWKLEPVTTADIGAVTNVATEEETLPGSFALAQNYPNPFNPVTTIQYEIATSGRVTLEVVDVLGRTVATLVDGEVASGAYQVQFDARDLASGLYLYRLTAGTQTITKKMMVLK